MESYGFRYSASEVPKVEWYMNFADENLFTVYGGPLFAQDEIQVTEHPVLASVKEAALKLQAKNDNLKPKTKENNRSTPILIRNAERRVAISVSPNALEGRPSGLYGSNFMNASPEAITKATKPIQPPTTSNILAMEAPKFGSGEYSQSTISTILSTAYTGYLAAIEESKEHLKDQGINGDPQVVIHTGHWGCGAYGGNKNVMAIIQLIAAHLAHVDILVYHVLDNPEVLQQATPIVEKLMVENASISTVVMEIQKMGFKWGITDALSQQPLG
uniref:PARG catalytic Macro domain-containing protein n=1 Tax=Arcella intermedia TaxID=1963864 RepID=A0A6B2LDL3_9EUKA